jgi:Rrf2 family protein
MKLSTRTRYGTRALVELARAWPGASVSVRDMATSQKLSIKYLENILVPLKSAGLVTAARGVKGGYKLTRAPEKVRLSDIYEVLEGSSAPVACVDYPETCPLRKDCPTRDVWCRVGRAVQDVLNGTTLADLARKKGMS